MIILLHLELFYYSSYQPYQRTFSAGIVNLSIPFIRILLCIINMNVYITYK